MRIVVLAIALQASASAPAATFVATSTADTAGASCGSSCTRRQATTSAHATTAADTINFALPLPIRGELLIQPATALPSTTALRGWALCASGSVVKELAITRFARTGIIVGDSPCAARVGNVQLHGNFIGVTGSGTAAAGNGDNGIRVVDSGIRIGRTVADRNVISANGVSGIDLRGGSLSKVAQNILIGTDKTDSQDFGNGTGVRTGDAASTSLPSQNPIRFNGLE
jgi:hypothetical protein